MTMIQIPDFCNFCGQQGTDNHDYDCPTVSRPTTTVYTDAPVAYDYEGTVDHGQVGHHTVGKGAYVRKVVIDGDADHASRYQCPRYGSGLYITLDQDGYDEWVKCGDLIPDPVRKCDHRRLDKVYYVNIYEVDRCFGGSEEGGWWYDCGTYQSLDQIFLSKEDAVVRMNELNAEFRGDQKEQRRFNRYSAAGETDTEAQVQTHPGQDYPDTKPHYE